MSIIIPKSIWILLTIWLFSPPTVSLFSAVQSLVKRVNVLQARSIRQEIIDNDTIVLSRDVEILVDDTVRIWADKVVVDKREESLVATSDSSRFVVVQSDTMFFLARGFSFSLKKKTGKADDVKVHLKDGFVSARHLYKGKQNFWYADHLMYTACDQRNPHWSILAQSAKIQSGYIIRIHNLIFKISHVPVFALPILFVPLHNRSHSGFLMPKFSYDDDLGLGIKQEFYWKIGQRCDTTLGIAWREKKGILFSDEFRWVRSNESYTLATFLYAREKNAFIQKGDIIRRGTKRHILLQASNYVPYTFLDKQWMFLNHIDFGSDKKIGFHFFNATNDIEDYFLNDAVIRRTNQHAVYFLGLSSEKVVRTVYAHLNANKHTHTLHKNSVALAETTDKFVVTKIPHVEFSTTFHKIFNTFFSRNDCVIDYVFGTNRCLRKEYFEGCLMHDHNSFAGTQADTVRISFLHQCQKHMRWNDNIFQVAVEPGLQLHTHAQSSKFVQSGPVIQGKCMHTGSYRIFSNCMLAWHLPECNYCTRTGDTWYVQPSVQWNYAPRFNQDHWFHFDHLDRVYGRNEIAGILNFGISTSTIQADCFLQQSCELFDDSSLFPLRLSAQQKYFSPLLAVADLTWGPLSLSVKSEFEFHSARLSSLEFLLNFSLRGYALQISSLYQDRLLQKRRSLLSDIAYMVNAYISLPLFKHVTIKCDGQFHLKEASWKNVRSSFGALMYRTYIEYKAHCWGIMLGFEEKRYRQLGNWRSENGFVISLSLDTLGSFSGRLKKPLVKSISRT